MKATEILLLALAAYAGLTLLLTVGLAAFVMWGKRRGYEGDPTEQPLVELPPVPLPHADAASTVEA